MTESRTVGWRAEVGKNTKIEDRFVTARPSKPFRSGGLGPCV